MGVLTGSVAQQNCNCACKLGRKNPVREKSGFLKGCSIQIPCPKTCGPYAVKNVRKTNFITPGEDCCKPLNTAKDCAMRGLFLCPNYDPPGFINHLKNRCVRTCRGAHGLFGYRVCPDNCSIGRFPDTCVWVRLC